VRVVGGSNPLVPTNFYCAVANILITNDDGIEAEGLICLEEHLQGLANIIIVAPDRERSAVSHGLTLRSPLTLQKIEANHYVLNGTPADCVIYSLRHLFDAMPDLIISGINHGANLSDDIMYSGTVAAAREASRQGIAALAVSQAYDDKPIQFKEGARFVRSLAETMLSRAPESAYFLNVNIPVRRIRGAKITRQGCSNNFRHYNALDREDGPQVPGALVERESDIMLDYHAIHDHYISITPLQRDQTDYAAAQALLAEAPGLFRKGRFPGLGLIGFKN
jgi:5'-nucleotidase